MRKFKKVISLFLTLTILLSCITMVPVSAEDVETYYLLNTNNMAEISKMGLAMNTKITHGSTYSAKWAFSKKGSLVFTSVTDISGYSKIEFALYSDGTYPAEVMVIVYSQNAETDGSDYYNSSKLEVKEGWNEYSVTIANMGKGRTPRGLDDIDSINIITSGWSLENNENTVLYADSVKLVTSDLYNEDGSINVNSVEVPAYKQVKSNAVSDVKNAVCLKVGSPFALVNHEQQRIDETNENAEPILENGEVMVPADFMERTMGFDISCTDEVVSATNGKCTLEFPVGSHITKKDGEEVILATPANYYNGVLMLPLGYVAENLGKKYFKDEMGLVIVSDSEINYTWENDLSTMLDITSGFIYERPGREKIKADITENTPEHPRILATAADFERIRGYRETDTYIKTWTNSLITKAEKYIKQVPAEEASGHPYSADAGGRLKSSYNVTDKATSLGMAYQMTGDVRYPEAMWCTLKDLCDREQWEHWHPGHFLNAAEVMWGVAIAYDWMYDAWTDDQKKIIEDALYDCGVEDSITAYYGATDYLSPPMGKWHRSGWWAQGNNWNAVCNSGVVASGLALATHETYSDLAIKAIDFALNGFEVGLRCYAPDGGYEEGPGYWSYGTNHAVLLMAAMSTAAGTNYGLSDAPGFDVTYATPLYSESKKGMFNYSDTSASRTDTASLFWFGKEYDNAKVNGNRLNEIISKEKSATYKDVLWYDPGNVDTNSVLDLDYSFFKTDTFTLRSSWTDKNQLFAGLHGGSNTANHCQIDSGSFVFDALNTRWFLDFGSDNYNLPNYWSTGTGGLRWQYYSQRAEGHNTFVINPGLSEDQVIKSVSPVTEVVSGADGSYGKVDLTAAYATDASKATRGVMMTDNREAVIVQDEITMLAPSEFYWFAHTKAAIELSEDSKSAILTSGSQQIKVNIVSDNEDLVFTVMDAVPLPTSPVGVESDTQKEKSRAGIQKLVIHGSDVESINLAVVMQPVSNDYTYTYTNLDDWSVTSRAAIVAQALDIRVDSVSVKNFSPEKTSYEAIVDAEAEAVSKIEVEVDENTGYAAELPKSLPGRAIIKVFNKEDESIYTLYTVNIRAAKEIEIEASGEKDGNAKENCLDKNFETSWAVDGEGWGTFTFMKPKTVSSVWVASNKVLQFDIKASYDGESFTEVLSGQSTSGVNELEEFKISRGTYKAIKLVLNSSANSISEVDFTNDAPEGTVTVNIDTEGGESISVNGESKGKITAEQAYTGSVLELVANGSGEFMYWIDSDSKIVLSNSEAYSYTVGSARNIRAVYAPEADSVITFTSMAKWLETGASGLITPKNPYVYGYAFNGWYINGEKTELEAGGVVSADSNAVIKAGFIKDRAKYIVTADGVMKSRAYNEKMMVSAPSSKDGKDFSYWKRDGHIVSYDKDYSFYVTGKTTLESVYGESAQKASVLVMSNPSKAEENKIAFFAELDIISDLEVIESGIIVGENEGLTLENAQSKVASKKAENKAQLTVRRAYAKEGTSYYATAYAVCRDASGNIITLYSNEVSYTN